MANENAVVKRMIEGEFLNDGMSRGRVKRKDEGPIEVRTYAAEAAAALFFDDEVGFGVDFDFKVAHDSPNE